MTIAELLKAKSLAIVEHKAITDGAADGLTDEQRAHSEGILARMDGLNRDIATAQRMVEEERSMAGVGLPQAALTSMGASPEDKLAKAGLLFATLGDQMAAIRAASAGNPEARAQLMAAAAGANEAVDSEGGFLLLPQFTSAIEQNMYTMGEILSRVRSVEIGASSNGLTLRTIDETSRATGSRFGGVRGYWVDEADSITSSQPKFGRMELKLKKVAALGYATDELLADVPAMTSIFDSAFADELTFLVEDAIINGDGASKPLGIVGHSGTVSVAKETGQAAATIEWANVLKMRSRQWAASRLGSVWLINQEVEEVLPQMSLVVGTGGVPVYLPATGTSESGFDRLFGLPVIPVEYCAALGTVGDIILCNLSEYLMIRKGGINTASSMHVRFTSAEMAFRATYRCDGQPVWASPMTPFKSTSGRTLSPIITLATRA